MLVCLFLLECAAVIYAALSFFLSGEKSGANPAAGKYLFYSVSVAFIFVSCSATVLASLGIYSLPTLALATGFICVAGFAFCLKKRRLISPRAICAGLAQYRYNIPIAVILLVFTLLNVLFPTAYLNGYRDPGAYLVHAVHVADTGRIPYTDEYIRELYPSVNQNLSMGFSGFYSSYNNRARWPNIASILYGSGQTPAPGDYNFQFLQFFPCTLAVGYSLFGMAGLLRVNCLIALLALLSAFYFAEMLFDRKTASLLVVFLSLCPAQIWGARITQTEILCQYLFFLSMIIFISGWRRNGRIFHALAAALLIGIACICRVDSYIWGVAIGIYICYAALFDHNKQKYIFSFGLAYGVVFLLSFAYNYTLSPIYIMELWPFSLKYLAIVYVVLSILCFPLYLTGKRVTQLREKNMVLHWLDMKYTSLILAAGLSLAFVFAYFIRPLLDVPDKKDPNIFFPLNAMVEFCWYTSFLAIPLAILGIYFFLRKKEPVRESSFIFLLIGLISVVLYIYMPSIMPDHIWASRRWITVNIPFLLLFCAHAIIQLGDFVKSYGARRAAAACTALSVCIGGYLFWRSTPFLAKQMLSDYPEQYAQLADKLDDDALYLTTSSVIASPLHSIYNKNVYMYKALTRSLVKKMDNVYFIGESGEQQLCAGFTAEKIDEFVLHGAYPEEAFHYYPKEFNDLALAYDIYKLTLMDFDVEDPFHQSDTIRFREEFVSRKNQRTHILTHGPFLTVPTGSYEFRADVELIGCSDPLLGWIHVISSPPTKQLYTTALHAEDFIDNKLSLSIPFSTLTGETWLDFRIRTTLNAEIKVTNVSLTQTADRYIEVFAFNRFHTENGRREDKSIVSDGSEGLLLCGNYRTLPAGAYTYELDLDLLDAAADEVGWVDVCKERGQVIARIALNKKALLNDQGIFIIPFSSLTDIRDVELRVFADNGTVLQANEVLLTCSGAAPSMQMDVNSIHTENGMRKGQSITSNGSGGLLACGNYMSLDAGDYQYSADLELLTAKAGWVAWVDVCKEQGETIARIELEEHDFISGKYTAVLPFALDALTQDIEFRVYTEDSVVLKVSNITIEKEEKKATDVMDLNAA